MFQRKRRRVQGQLVALFSLSLALVLGPATAQPAAQPPALPDNFTYTTWVNVDVATIEQLVEAVSDVRNLNSHITLTSSEYAPIFLRY